MESNHDSNPIVSLSNVSIGYGSSKRVASNLNATLSRGSLTCLLGANGTGKSTLIRTICALQPMLEGSIELDGVEVSHLTAQQLSKRLSIVLTDRLDVANATVEELVSYGRSPYTGFLGRLSDHDKKMVDYSLKCCQIGHKRKELLANLSDGERQKAVIAKAMAQDTPLIVLDEPTAFLDLPTRVEIMQLLRELATSFNKAILMSTHDMELALQMSDKLWIMQKGGELQAGSPEDLQLSGAFEQLFHQTNVKLDIRTGLFKVSYNFNHTLPTVGHGFHFVLLRRAFARKGIKLDHSQPTEGIWLKIENLDRTRYLIYFDDTLISAHQQVDEAVTMVDYYLKSPSLKHLIDGSPKQKTT